MRQIKVYHQSIAANWIKPDIIQSPKTLVLGSFNPYKSDTNSVDYFYGRGSNHFWKTIAIIINEKEDFFFEKGFQLQRKIEIMQNKFCCLDVINSIAFSSQSEEVLNDYLNKEIYSNFKDQKIWAGFTNYDKKDKIYMARDYNKGIIEYLESSDSVRTIIHTMGSNRISPLKVNPIEAKLKNVGFGHFFNDLKSICERKNISFIYESWSPSDYAVKNGFTPKERLKNWLEWNLHFKSAI